MKGILLGHVAGDGESYRKLVEPSGGTTAAKPCHPAEDDCFDLSIRRLDNRVYAFIPSILLGLSRFDLDS